MLVAASADPGCALLIDGESLATRSIPLPPPARLSIVVANTGVDRTLAGSAYADRRAACERVAEALGASSLRRVDRGTLETAELAPADRRRALHVVAENERTHRAVEALEGEDLAGFGDLLFASHESLRDLYEVSCPELDTVVESARALREASTGVYGARMTGAGFGGCAIVACTGDAIADVTARLRADFRAAHGRDIEPFAVRAVGGSRALERRFGE